MLYRGRVVRRDRAGAAGALVAVAHGTAPTPEIAIRCDRRGCFQIGLPPGRYVIEARAPDGDSGSARVITSGSPQTIEIILGEQK